MKRLTRKNKAKKFYLNKVQLKFLSVVTAFRCWIGGRGSGKSTAIAYSILHKVKYMPGSAGLLTCITLDQLKTNTLAAIKKMWKRHNLMEGVHYVTFKKPPQHWLKNTIAPPDDFKNVIFFDNGTWLKIVSAKMYDAARGGSYDWAEIDEAGFFPEAFYTDILAASIRGNIGVWDCPVHQQVSFYSSMPTNHEGRWLLKFEELMQTNPADFFYMESTAYDNIKIFGKKNLERIKKLLPYLKFQVEFMNLRVVKALHAYYLQFKENVHVYGDIDEFATNLFYNPKKALSLTFDLGGWYSCLGVFQEYQNTEYGLHDFDASKEESLRDLIGKFDEVYGKMHKYKVVKIYGDPTGHNPTAFGKSAYQEIAEALSELGWQVEICVRNTVSDSHQWRYTQMNNLLAEDNELLPRLRLHRHHCKDSIISMQITEATPDFKKDKSTEKDKKFPQQHAPHNTDKIDYFIMQKYGYKFGLYYDMLENEAGVA